MRFMQLFGVLAVFIPHCLAAFDESGGPDNLRLIYDVNEQLAPSQLEAYDQVIVSGQVLASCRNRGEKLKADVGNCDPYNSKGFLSAHNCKNKGGSYYYCVAASGGTGTCTQVRNAVGLENGECFL